MHTPLAIAPSPSSATRRACTDRGFSLVEVLVAIVLMGLAVIPLMLSGVMSVRSSGLSRELARVETVLANAADRINRAPESCNYDVVVQAAALAEGWASDRVTVTYAHYQPASLPTVWGSWIAGACPGTQRPQGLVQRLTVTVTSPSGDVSRTLVVVKSDV